MKIIGIIPSRLESTRLPEKPLLDIDGLPMILHVYKRALFCKKLNEVYVATCNKEIYDVITKNNGKAIMTSKEHKTGTDRIAEAAKNIDCDIVVNIQGDEPLLLPEHIEKAIQPLLDDPNLQLTCLACLSDQLNDKDEVKLVLNLKGDIMYFSRSDIPSTLRTKHNSVLKQYCIYAFRKNFLLEFSKWEQTPLEKIEFVELLRALERGYKIKGIIINENTQSVDTKEQLKLVNLLIKKDSLRKKY